MNGKNTLAQACVEQYDQPLLLNGVFNRMTLLSIQYVFEAKRTLNMLSHQREEGLFGNNSEILIANVCQSCYGSAFQCERQSCPYGMGDHV